MAPADSLCRVKSSIYYLVLSDVVLNIRCTSDLGGWRKRAPGGGCWAGEEIDTSQQRDTREFYIIVEEKERGERDRERQEKEEWAVCRVVASARTSRDKSVYGEVMGWFTDWGVVGTIAAIYTRVKVNARIPYADTLVDATRVSSTLFPLFTARGTKKSLAKLSHFVYFRP